MTDQCKHCAYRGDIDACLSDKCFHHENWYAKKQQSTINELIAQNERLREAASDYLYYSDDCSSASMYSSARDCLDGVLSETTAQSLEALKLEWQIERDAESLRAQEEILARVQSGSDILNNKDKTPIERIVAFSKVIGVEDLESIDADNGEAK